MAVVTARRVGKPQRVAKHRSVKILAETGFLIANSPSSMPQDFQVLSPTELESRPLVSPSFANQADDSAHSPGIESLTKKRKASKFKPPLELRRAVSTPQIRGLAMNEPGISPTGDKRRNKLGYHRTSVACGHCRRRKIRCLLPSPEDAQGRCANCIRLKKECNFYPVTDANQQERGGKKGAGSGVASASDPSSPRPSGSSNPSSVDDLQGPIHLQSQPQHLQSISQGDGYPLPQLNGAVHFQQPHYSGYPSLHHEGWSNSSDYASQHSQPPPQPQTNPQEALSPYWSSAHTPVSSSFQTSPQASVGGASSTPFDSPNFSYQQHQGWSQPRSVSFGHVEQLPRQYSYHQTPEHRSPSLPFPPQVPSNTHPITSAEQHPNTLPASSQPIANYSYQQPWAQPYPPSQAIPSAQERQQAESYTNNWYQEPTQIARPEEPSATAGQYGHPSAYYPQASQSS